MSPGSFLDGRTLAEANLELETGYYLLAIRRAGRYLYRPAQARWSCRRATSSSRRVPTKAASRLAELGGYRVLEDDATGEIALVRVDSCEPAHRSRRSISVDAAASDATHRRPTGLTAAEVQERVARGQTNDTGERTSRTLGEIVRANVFTRFNAILGADARGDHGDRADPGRHRSR